MNDKIQKLCQANVYFDFAETVFSTYGKILFSNSYNSSFCFILATFFNFKIGLFALAGNILANLFAHFLGVHKGYLKAGVFGINGVFTGIAIAQTFIISTKMAFIFVLTIFLLTILVIVFLRLFKYWDFPVLTVPFLLAFWAMNLGFFQLKSTEVTVSEVSSLISIPYLNDIFEAFSSILFQHNWLSGILVLIGIFLVSKINFFYAICGFILGLIFHFILNDSFDGFLATSIPLNSILTSIAIGGFFIVHTKENFIFTSYIVLIACFLTGFFDTLLGIYGISAYVASFNATVLLTLLALKSDLIPQRKLNLISVPLYLIANPEAHQKWWKELLEYESSQKTVLTLPFWGEWKVTQAHFDSETHKGLDGYALDFKIADFDDSTFHGLGLNLTDYYCFQKPVLAPADGIIVAAENEIADNPIGTVNKVKNWGNYVVIDHQNGEFSEISHFFQGSIKVKIGNKVTRGQILGLCGNSGNSLEPHIHYQLQKADKVGSETIEGKFSNYIQDKELIESGIPNKGSLVKNGNL